MLLAHGEYILTDPLQYCLSSEVSNGGEATAWLQVGCVSRFQRGASDVKVKLGGGMQREKIKEGLGAKVRRNLIFKIGNYNQ